MKILIYDTHTEHVLFCKLHGVQSCLILVTRKVIMTHTLARPSGHQEFGRRLLAISCTELYTLTHFPCRAMFASMQPGPTLNVAGGGVVGS